jgi:hypothetical protein
MLLKIICPPTANTVAFQNPNTVSLMPAFITTNFDGYTDGNFTIATNNIITAFTDNPDFPQPPFAMDEVKKKFDMYKSVSKERYLMSPKDTSDRNTLRKEITKMLRANGVYVIALFPDDRDKQLSSQYPPVKSKNDTGEPDAPTRMKASKGSNSGEALLNWKGSSIAKSYNVKYRIKDTNAAWSYKTVTKSRGVIIAGLIPGELYEFWAQAVGTKKDSDYGGPAELRIV